HKKSKAEAGQVTCFLIYKKSCRERQDCYSMKIKEQTRKLAAGCSKHCFEVVDETDEVSNHTYGKAKLTWFEEIFEEYEV
ncbi:hypothetical protein C5O69_06675, partial [Streptococcus pseudopneumoniae]